MLSLLGTLWPVRPAVLKPLGIYYIENLKSPRGRRTEVASRRAGDTTARPVAAVHGRQSDRHL